MGIWDRLFGRKSAASGQSRFWLDLLDTVNTVAGIRVTPDSAPKQSAVWAAINVRSEDIGKLPCILYRRLPDGSRERATTHPLYRLIGSRPNTRHTAFEFRQMLQLQLDVYGNALAVKELSGTGDVTALWPVPWPKVAVLQSEDGYELFYRITMKSGQTMTLPAEMVLHLRGKSFDGVVGVSPITYHAETIGLALAQDRYTAALFGNSARPSGALKVKQVLSKEASAALRSDWESKLKGPEKTGSMVVLDGEMDWTPFSMTQDDAQYVESKGISNADIFRIYRIPPHKAGDLTRSTNNNIEHQGLEYVTDCLMPICVNWEQALARDLLTEDEQGDYFFEFLVDALLRGDIKSRYEAFAIARSWGAMSANDWRDKENMNRIANGDIYLQPLNYIEAGTAPAPSASTAKALLAYAQQLVAREDGTNEP